jgi:hypothetical protein
MTNIPIAVEKLQITEELDLDALIPLLPEGAEVTAVEHRGQPVINVRVARDWQVAINVAKTRQETIDNVVRAAWIHECELEHDLLFDEIRDAYQAQMAELLEWHWQNAKEKIDLKLAAAKPAREAPDA